MRQVVPLVLIILTLSLTRGLASAQSEDASLSLRLAAIESNGSAQANDKHTKRLESLLRTLSKKYPETKEQITEMTILAWQTLKKKGASESIEQIMSGMDEACVPAAKQEYISMLAPYVAMRSGGTSTKDAVAALRAMLSDFLKRPAK